jgi:retinol dehydrogenase-12
MSPQLQPLANKVALVTGSNTGIGRATALELARQGARVFLACRSEDATRPVLAEIEAGLGSGRAVFLPLDLADFDSVRSCAARFLALDLPLHLLINNAGLVGRRGLTASGFELAFGVNHVGHFLLTDLLLARIRVSAPARIVTVASQTHARAKSIDFAAVRRPTAGFVGTSEYAVSKLANVLFSAELGRRLVGTGVTTYAVHPGVVASDVWRSTFPAPIRWLLKHFMATPEQGAQTTLHCATDPGAARETGLYYDDCRIQPVSSAAQDLDLARSLWQRTERWIEEGREEGGGG